MSVTFLTPADIRALAERVDLKPNQEKTAQSVTIREDGSLTTEFYDFSPDAHRMLGNDVAWGVRVASDNKDDLLLALLVERFPSVLQIKPWPEEHAIPFESWWEDPA